MREMIREGSNESREPTDSLLETRELTMDSLLDKKDDDYCDFNKLREKAEISRRMEIQLQDMEFKGDLTFETDSVYGAVIAMPQIARCMGWNQTFLALCFRSFLLLGLNYVFQVSALIFISEESQVMDVLGGKMHLCDYGKRLDECKNFAKHPGCVGPGGTAFKPPRLYGFDAWNVRKWARDNLVALFEGDEEVIANLNDIEKVDPGEYGIENSNCRLFACFLFTLAEVQAALKILELIWILWSIPTMADSWVFWREDGDDLDPLGSLKFRTAGMPLGWKMLNFVIVVLPKIFLLCEVYWMGFRFLMDTAGIIDLVLGAMAMDFILTFDELILESFDSECTKTIMERIEGFVVDQTDEEDFLEDAQSGGRKVFWGSIFLATPRRLIIVITVLITFVQLYYMVHCQVDPETNSWASKPTMLPNTTQYSLRNLLYNYVPPQINEETGEPVWAWQPVAVTTTSTTPSNTSAGSNTSDG